MNNKGFTLIELLVTIVLLGVIATISFVSINKVIEKNKRNNYYNFVAQIKTAAKEYASDNKYDGLTEITLTTLITNNYLKASVDSVGNIENPYTGKKVNTDNIKVIIDKDNNYTVSGLEAPLVYGDVNSDGKVNDNDKIKLAKYLAGWDGYTLSAQETINADVNLDGKVDNADRLILARYLAGEEGYTLPYVKDVPSETGTKYGDVNSDGKVDDNDKTKLVRYLAGWDGYTLSAQETINADVNLDGKVDNVDRLILARYLAGEQGYTLPYINEVQSESEINDSDANSTGSASSPSLSSNIHSSNDCTGGNACITDPKPAS